MTQNQVTPEVATELLCRSVPMSGKERRELFRARFKPLFVADKDGKETRLLKDESIRVKYLPLGVSHRLEYRLGQRSWQQLLKWRKRGLSRRGLANDRRSQLSKQRTKLGEKTGKPSDRDIQDILLLGQALAAIEAKIQVLDIFLDALGDEMLRRQKLWESVAKAGAVKFARELKKKITQ